MKKKIVVLVSGGGTNLQALIDAQKSGIIESGHLLTGAYGKGTVKPTSFQHITKNKFRHW